MTNQTKVDRSFVESVGATVLAAQLAGHRDVSEVASERMDMLADMAVRAAIALDRAIPRAEERMVNEHKAADDARRAEDEARKAAETAARTEEKAAAASAKSAHK